MQIENSLFRSLDQLVRTRLEPVWHLASTKTKQMVEDLKVLRSLFSYLVNYDSVTFYLYLETIKEANKLARGAGYSNLYSWLLLDGSNIVFDCGRSRVYDKITKPNGSSEFVPKFDVQPKWKVLVQIIKEIEAERATFDKKSSRNVLIFTPDGRVSYQIRTLISKLDMSFKDKKRNKAIYENTLNFQLESYLKSKENMNKVTSHFSKSLPSAPNGTGNKRRRVLPNKRTDDTQDVINYSTLEVSQPEIYCDTGHSHIYVRSTSSFGEDDTHWNMLYEIMPQWIILYSPDITLVRRIEVFKALFPSKQLKVYFLVYDNSVEEQQYLTTLTKEKSAFQQLIEKKGVRLKLKTRVSVYQLMRMEMWSLIWLKNSGAKWIHEMLGDKNLSDRFWWTLENFNHLFQCPYILVGVT